MSSVDNNVNSYDIGGKPFKHDDKRGKWQSMGDFYLGCIGHAFSTKCFTILPFFLQYNGGIFFIVPYTIALFLFALPIFIFQSFLGQFSSTGFISVFRISPLFKGIGYVILILNIGSICYFSAFVAYPLMYFLVSFYPFTLPWMSCENSFNTPNCTVNYKESDNTSDDTPFYYTTVSWSSLEFFEYGIGNVDNDNEVTKIAWPIFFGTILIWMILAAIFYKGFEMTAIAIRVCSSISLLFFIIFFVRVLCLPPAFEGVLHFLTPSPKIFRYAETYVTSPFITVFMFGSGWGTVLTMASYNNFKEDVIKYSQIIGFGLMILFGMCVIVSFTVEGYLYDYLSFSHFNPKDFLLEFVLVAFPHFLGHLEAAHLWSIIFFGMLFLCELCGLIIQLLSILTAIFDEYENLREEKRRITLAIITCLCLGSLIFTTNKEAFFFHLLTSISGFTQMMICLLELIVVVWFYGRLRFQRDIQFMLGKSFATWKFFIIRFITPLFIIITIIIFLAFSIGGISFKDPTIFEVFLIFLIKIVPWVCVPGYIVYKLLNTTGTFCHRFKKSLWPTDWYPFDPIYRQRYEETLGASDISHQLVIMKPDDEEC